MDYILRGLSYRLELFSLLLFKRYLQVIFNRQRYFNCHLNLRKCNFDSELIEYLGHVIIPHGIVPKPILVDAIRKYPSPGMLDPLRQEKSVRALWFSRISIVASHRALHVSLHSWCL